MILRFKKLNPILSFFKIYQDVKIYTDKTLAYISNGNLIIFPYNNQSFNFKKYDYYFIEDIDLENVDIFLTGARLYLQGVNYLTNCPYGIRKLYPSLFQIAYKNNVPIVSTMRKLNINQFDFALNACLKGLNDKIDVDKKLKSYLYTYKEKNDGVVSSLGLFLMLRDMKIGYKKLK